MLSFLLHLFENNSAFFDKCWFCAVVGPEREVYLELKHGVEAKSYDEVSMSSGFYKGIYNCYLCWKEISDIKQTEKVNLATKFTAFNACLIGTTEWRDLPLHTMCLSACQGRETEATWSRAEAPRRSVKINCWWFCLHACSWRGDAWH